MSDPVVEALIVDLLSSITARDRTYAEVIDAWRTSCPKLTVWEDANDRGLVATERVNGEAIVRPTAAGRALLEQHRRARVSAARAAD
jgi:D-3-phosphoglycerate dehydrogenase